MAIWWLLGAAASALGGYLLGEVLKEKRSTRPRLGKKERHERLTIREFYEKHIRGFLEKIAEEKPALPEVKTQAKPSVPSYRLIWIVPLALCIGLVISFSVWDWHGLAKWVCISGLIGYFTNDIAIRMLFWPRRPLPIIGQGLIPKKWESMKESIADIIVKELVNTETIKNYIVKEDIVSKFSNRIQNFSHILQAKDFRNDLKRLILTFVNDFLTHSKENLKGKLERCLPGGLAGFILDICSDVRDKLEKLIDELPKMLDPLINKYLDEGYPNIPKWLDKQKASIDDYMTKMIVKFVTQVDIKRVILRELDKITPEEAEKQIQRISGEQFQLITAWGGILGAVVGGAVALLGILSGTHQ